MTSCCPPPRMRWSGATGAIAKCKRVSTGCGRKRRSVPAWPWICGVKPTPKAVNKPSPHSIVYGLDKPGVFTTVSNLLAFSTQSSDHRRGSSMPVLSYIHQLFNAEHCQAWHCQVVGDDVVTRQQKALSGRDCHRPDA